MRKNFALKLGTSALFGLAGTSTLSGKLHPRDSGR